MTRTTTLTESIVVEAAPAEVYAAVSDLTRMGRWSPENTGATPIEAGPAAAGVGATYWGHNRRNALMRWTTYVEVTAAEPGKRFAFRSRGMRVATQRVPMPIATWEYQFAAAPGGTEVTQTWTDDRGSDVTGLSARTSSRLVIGGRSFVELTRRNMRATLQRLKADLEEQQDLPRVPADRGPTQRAVHPPSTTSTCPVT